MCILLASVIALPKEYEGKYSSLEREDKSVAYACNDPTSPLGTPAQALLIDGPPKATRAF